MIATADALPTFDRMLADAGFDAAQPDPRLAWRVFKTFAALPVACAEDGLLFQCGTLAFTGTSLFHYNFTRQFTHEEDGEYAGMEQLGCTMFYAPTDELTELDMSCWSFDFPTLADFFAHVEALPAFQLPVERYAPLRAELDQENV